jgi:hypothetical protein
LPVEGGGGHGGGGVGIGGVERRRFALSASGGEEPSGLGREPDSDANAAVPERDDSAKRELAKMLDEVREQLVSFILRRHNHHDHDRFPATQRAIEPM